MCYLFAYTSFIFSCRRRHTSWPRDWSSDVCSSDLSGRLSDISSRRVMSIGAAIASALLVLIVSSAQFLPQQISFYLLPIGFFAINLVHTGIRIARKNYDVVISEG